VEDCILFATFSNGTTANQAVAKARDSLMAVHRGFITGESTTAADDFFVGLIFDKLFVGFFLQPFYSLCLRRGNQQIEQLPARLSITMVVHSECQLET
jgi:hypothetical protein